MIQVQIHIISEEKDSDKGEVIKQQRSTYMLNTTKSHLRIKHHDKQRTAKQED